MLGNDVVDLRERAERSRPQQDRFDRRVFTPAERAAIAASRDAERTRWQLWAAKEAAYKAARREDGAIAFSPVKFEVTLAPQAARVRHPRGGFGVRLDSPPHGVHALAWRDSISAQRGSPPAGCHRAWRRIPGLSVREHSAAVRALVRSDLATLLDVCESALEIEQRERIPWLRLQGGGDEAPLSLSHHGDLVAFACLLPETWRAFSSGAAPRRRTA